MKEACVKVMEAVRCQDRGSEVPGCSGGAFGEGGVSVCKVGRLRRSSLRRSRDRRAG